MRRGKNSQSRTSEQIELATKATQLIEALARLVERAIELVRRME